MPYQDDLRRYFGEIARYAEPALTAGSAMVAEPVSGLAGLGALLRGRGVDGAVESINAAQQAMTYQPRTMEGQQGLQGLQAFLQPVGEVIQGASQNLGDKAYSATGSPALAAAAYSAPTAFLEGLGLKGLNIARKPVSGADLYSARMGMGDIPDEFKADFDRWFRGSKVKSAGKSPRVVFHGTSSPRQLDEFKDGVGFFSESPEYASSWATGYRKIQPDGTSFPEDAQVIPTYLSIKKPYDGDKNELGLWLEEDVYNDDVLNLLKSKGYDGAFWTDGMYNGYTYKNWITFDPAQIKSATGNSGQFSRKSKKISE